MCVCVTCAHMNMVSEEARGGCRISSSGIVSYLNEHWKPNLCSLEEQFELFAIDLALSNCFLCHFVLNQGLYIALWISMCITGWSPSYKDPFVSASWVRGLKPHLL